MSTPAPRPADPAGVDPVRLTEDVTAALADNQHAETAQQVALLEALHQRLAATLTTIDRA